MEANEDVIRFTAKELLARLDVKLDEIKASMDVRLHALEGRVLELEKQNARDERLNDSAKDHEGRIRGLEKKVIILSTVAASAGGAIGGLADVLVGMV